MLGIVFAIIFAIGDTAKAPLYRLGISLEHHIANVVSVAEGGHYKVYVPYSNTVGIRDGASPVGTRLYVVTGGKGVYYTGDVTKGEWQPDQSIMNFLGSTERFESTRGLYIIRKRPVVRSIWYVYGDYGVIRMVSSTPNINKMHLYLNNRIIKDLVPVPEVDTEVVCLSNDSIFRVIFSGDSAEVVFIGFLDGTSKLSSTSYGVYAYGNSGIYKVYPGSVRQVFNTNTVSSLVEMPVDSNLYAGTDNGIYVSRDGGNSWANILLSGKAIISIGAINDTLFVVPESDSVVYYYTGTDLEVYGRWPSYLLRLGVGLVSKVVEVNRSATFLTPLGVFVMENGYMYNMSGSTPDKLFFDNVSTALIDTMVKILKSFDSIYERMQTIFSDYNLTNVPAKVNFVVYPIYQYVNTENDFILDYLPFYGYALKHVEEGLSDEIGINVTPSFPLSWISFIDADTSLREAILAYNLSKLVLLDKIVDDSRTQPLVSGLAAYLAQEAGFDLAYGFVRDNVEFATNYNQELLSGSMHHPNALDVREVDRERLLYFFEFIKEKYGSNSIKRIITLGNYHNYERISEALDSISLDEALKEWGIKNVFGGYQINPSFRVLPTTAPVIEPLNPYSTYYLTLQPGNAYSLNLSDDIGETWYSLVLYSRDSIMDLVYTDTIRKYKKFAPSTRERTLLLVNGSPNSYYCGFSTDVIPPDSPRFYLIQNAGFVPYITAYAFGNEKLYNDVGSGPEFSVPQIILYNSDTTIIKNMEHYFTADTIFAYKLHDYFDVSGDFYIKVRSEDIFGNSTASSSYPISIFTLNGNGLFSLLNGRLTLNLPVDLHVSGFKIIATYSSAKNELFYTVGSNSIVFMSPVKVTFAVPRDWKRVKVLRWQNGEWVPLQDATPLDGRVEISTKMLGTFKLSRIGHIEAGTKAFKISINTINSDGKVIFSVNFPQNVIADVKLIDAMGRVLKYWKVKSDKDSRRRLVASTNKAGVFYIVVSFNNETHIKKIIISK